MEEKHITMNKTQTLVINCGSSSLKFALMPNDGGTDPILSGLAECLGDAESSITYKTAEGKKQKASMAAIMLSPLVR